MPRSDPRNWSGPGAAFTILGGKRQPKTVRSLANAKVTARERSQNARAATVVVYDGETLEVVFVAGREA